jgi:hypothetical protein
MARPVARRRPAAAALPEWIRPQLTQLVDQAPDGPDWLHEIKFDGYRMQARLDRGAVRLLTRNGLDWTHNAEVNGRCRPLACRTRCSPPARKRSVGKPIGCQTPNCASIAMPG